MWQRNCPTDAFWPIQEAVGCGDEAGYDDGLPSVGARPRLRPLTNLASSAKTTRRLSFARSRKPTRSQRVSPPRVRQFTPGPLVEIKLWYQSPKQQFVARYGQLFGDPGTGAASPQSSAPPSPYPEARLPRLGRHLLRLRPRKYWVQEKGRATGHSQTSPRPQGARASMSI